MEAENTSNETMEQNKETLNKDVDDDLTQYDESMETAITNNTESVGATTESAIQFSHFDSIAQDSVNDSNMEDSAPVAVATDTENSEVMDESPEENEESAVDALPDSETIDLTEGTTEEHNGDEDDGPTKLNQLPISKIRKIMKFGLGEDTEVRIVAKEAAFLVGQATELFVAAIAQETAKITLSSKKKIMNMQHLTATICDSEVFSFLEGTMVPDYDF